MPSPSTTQRYVVPPRGSPSSTSSAASGRTRARREARRLSSKKSSGSGPSCTTARVSASAIFIASISECDARLEPVVERQREQRRSALAVRRQLADLDPPIRAAQAAHPLRPVGEEILLGEPRAAAIAAATSPS